MKILAALPALLTAAVFSGFAAAPAHADSSELLSRLITRAEHPRSYTANVHADVAMHTFPYISPQLDGTYYHKEPSRDKIIFTSGLPFIAKEFSKIYPHVESPSRWHDVYIVSAEADDGKYTTFKLVPRKHGRIDHIDARVDDQTADLVQLRWVYNDGGYATLNQRYGHVNGYDMVVEQQGHVEVPHYNADVTSTFSNFRTNASIPDSIFAGES